MTDVDDRLGMTGSDETRADSLEHVVILFAEESVELHIDCIH